MAKINNVVKLKSGYANFAKRGRAKLIWQNIENKFKLTPQNRAILRYSF
jgi:hypothetical protein